MLVIMETLAISNAHANGASKKMPVASEKHNSYIIKALHGVNPFGAVHLFSLQNRASCKGFRRCGGFRIHLENGAAQVAKKMFLSGVCAKIITGAPPA
jgi:hypothetical protein